MTDTDNSSATSDPGGGAAVSPGHWTQRTRLVLPGRLSPWCLIPALTLAIASISIIRPIRDVDSYWHVLLGYDIVERHRFTGAPEWTFGPSHDWTTTQWGSEVLFAALHATLGWKGLTIFAAICLVAVMAGALALIRHGAQHAQHAAQQATQPPTSSGPTAFNHPLLGALFAGVALCASIDVHERPAALSYVALLAVAYWAFRGMETGQWPRWWVAAAASLAWAQFHGYWVMLPAAITLAALLRALDNHTVKGWHAPFLAALAATVAGALTPAGLYGLYAPLVFRDAASPFISEWAPTALGETPTALLGVAVGALTVAAWAKSTTPVPARWVTWGLLLALFAASAYRNVTPALILILPVAAASLVHAWPTLGRGMPSTRITRAAIVGLSVSTVAGLTTSLLTLNPIPNTAPTGIFSTIDASPGERRVLNDYDLGGQLLALTGPHVKVAVDGRSDRYRRDILDPYFAMLRIEPGWENTLRAYAPTDIVVRNDYPLGRVLFAQGWQQIQSEGRYSLWRRR